MTHDEDNSILPYRLQFADPALEIVFHAWQLASVRRVLLVAFAIMIPISLTNLFLDYQNGQGASVSALVSFLRISIILASSIGFGLLVGNIKPHLTGYLLEALLILLMAMTLARGLIESDYFTVGFISQLFYIFIIYLLCPFSWFRQIFYAGFFSFSCILLWEYRIEFAASFHRLGMGIPFANLLGATIARQRHLHERQLFASERRLTKELAQVHRLQRQQSEVLDLLTHELRQPLANIAAQGELIRRLDDSARTHALAERIVTTSTRAAKIIGDWIAGDRIAGSVLNGDDITERVQIADVVDEAVRQLLDQYPGLSIVVHERKLPVVLIERRVLALALHNLLENAVRHANSPRGIVVSFRITPRRVTVRIRDYGRGLTADELDRIFLKHVTTHNANNAFAPLGSDGTGIGLFLVREMLARCNASIRVQSQEGVGSAFLVEVPRIDC